MQLKLLKEKNYYTQYLPQKYGMRLENLYLNTPQEARMSSTLFLSYTSHTCCLPTCRIHVKMLLIPCQASRGAVFVWYNDAHRDASYLAQCVLLSIDSNVWGKKALFMPFPLEPVFSAVFSDWSRWFRSNRLLTREGSFLFSLETSAILRFTWDFALHLSFSSPKQYILLF